MVDWLDVAGGGEMIPEKKKASARTCAVNI